MRTGKFRLACVLMSAMAWSQTPPTAASPAPNQAPAAAEEKPQTPAPPADPGAALPANTVVLTITVKAPCGPPKPAPAKTAPAKPGEKTSAAAAKPATECKITYTKAEFEKIATTLVPNITPLQKRQFANALATSKALSEEAEAKGLDKTEHFKEAMMFRKQQVMAAELQQAIQKEAAHISDEDVSKYYDDNKEAYEQFNLERIYIPRFKQVDAKEVKEDEAEEKLTEEQQKEKREKEKARQTEGEQELAKLADSLRARAVQGEDFAKLQKEAYEASGMKVETPNVLMSKQRRTALPVSQSAVFDMDAGKVSEVFTDVGGHYIFKVDSKDVLPLDQVKNEIRGKLQNTKQNDLIQNLQGSFTTEPNETYFGGPLTGPAPGARQMPPRMPPGAHPGPPAGVIAPAPQGAAPNAPPAQNPPAQPPAPKPN